MRNYRNVGTRRAVSLFSHFFHKCEKIITNHFSIFNIHCIFITQKQDIL